MVVLTRDLDNTPVLVLLFTHAFYTYATYIVRSDDERRFNDVCETPWFASKGCMRTNYSDIGLDHWVPSMLRRVFVWGSI